MTHTTNVILTEKFEVLKPLKVLMAGLLATGVMTAFMLIAPFIGLPPINIGEFLGSFMGNHIALGWALHFAMGIALAYVYVVFFNHTIPVIYDTLRGLLFGILAFMVSQAIIIAISLTGLLTWDQKQDMVLMIFGNCVAHMLYGAVLGTFFKNK